jgi:hypothetical protein
MIKSTYLMKRLITIQHVIVPCSQFYTLISVFPEAILREILGSKPVGWVLNNTGHSLRLSLIIIIIIIPLRDFL